MKPTTLLHALAAMILSAVGAPACGGPIVAPLAYGPVTPAPEEPFRARAPEASPPEPAVLPPWRVTKLGNGLRVALLERHALPVVALRLEIDRGAADTGADHGTIGLLQAMLGAGTTARTAPALAAAYAELGAVHGGGAGTDGCMLSAKVGAADLDAALGLLAESATQPRFTAEAFNGARARWAQDLVNTTYVPGAVVQRNAAALLFGHAHAYGYVRPSAGRVADERVGDIAAIHASLFQPAHATLLVVGDATPEAVDAIVARRLGDWRAVAAPPPRAPAPPPPPDGPRVVLIESANQADTVVAVLARGPAAADPDALALAVLARAIGGHSSHLREELREERGAAYTFGAGLVAFRSASFVVLGGPLAADKAAAGLRAELSAVMSAGALGVGEADLARARTSLVAEWRSVVATTDGLTRLAADAIACGEPLEWVATYPARVAAVTGADVRRVAQRYLRRDALRVVVLGDRRLRGELEMLGLGPVGRRDEWADPL
jgi:zinc protease